MAFLSSLSMYSNSPKFSSEQRKASVKCFSLVNSQRLFMPPCVPDLISMGVIYKCLIINRKINENAEIRQINRVKMLKSDN